MEVLSDQERKVAQDLGRYFNQETDGKVSVVDINSMWVDVTNEVQKTLRIRNLRDTRVDIRKRGTRSLKIVGCNSLLGKNNNSKKLTSSEVEKKTKVILENSKRVRFLN